MKDTIGLGGFASFAGVKSWMAISDLRALSGAEPNRRSAGLEVEKDVGRAGGGTLDRTSGAMEEDPETGMAPVAVPFCQQSSFRRALFELHATDLWTV